MDNMPAQPSVAEGAPVLSELSSSLILASEKEELQVDSSQWAIPSQNGSMLLGRPEFYSEGIIDNNTTLGLAANTSALQLGGILLNSTISSSSSNSTLNGTFNATMLELEHNQHTPVDMSMIVNVTGEYPFEYAMVMFGYMLPFVLVITLVTNLLVVAVLYQNHMRTPTNIVLFAMAITDLCTLLSPSPWYLYIYTFGYYRYFLHPPILCYLHRIMTDVIPVFFHTSSIWLALLLASQRYIYVCHPTLARTWCTVPRVYKAIMWIVLVAFLHQFPRLFDNNFESVEIDYNHAKHNACRYSFAKWVEAIDVPLYYTSYYTFRIFFVFIIPSFSLIALNLLLFRALKRVENKRCQLLKTKFKLTDSEPGERHMKRNFSVTGSYLPGGGSSYNMGGGGGGGGGSGFGGTASALASHTIVEGRILNDSGSSSSRQSSPVSENTLGQVTPMDPGNDLKVSQRRPPATDSPRRKEGFNKKEAVDKRGANQVDEAGDIKRQSAGKASCGGWRQATSETQTSIDGRRSSSSSASRSRASSSRTSRSSRTSSKVGEDHESTCAECAAAFQKEEEEEAAALRGVRGACRRCSGGHDGVEGSTPPDGARSCHARNLQHQPVSQCSSILGGATNTITNEDISSSCPVTQNISGLIMVRSGGTLDNIEAADGAEVQVGAKGEDNEEETERTDNVANEEELSINRDEDGGPEGEKEEEEVRPADEVARCPRAGSGTGCLRGGGAASADSRLACGCFTAQASALRRVRLLSGAKTVESKAKDARDSYSMIECRQSELGSASEDTDGSGLAGSKFLTMASQSEEAPRIKNSTSLLLGFEDRQEQHQGRQKQQQEQQQEQQGQQGRMGNRERSRQQRAASQCPATLTGSHLSTAQPSATGTTSTTLYSAQTNSVGSLLQVQQQQQQQQPPQMGASTGRQHQTFMQRMKSPSYGGSITGRGSRATLLGSSAIPMIVSGQSGQQNNIHATVAGSSRTMDSNRTTLMLVVVVTVFLIVEVPVAMVTIAHVVVHLFDRFKDVQVQEWLDYTKLFTNFFIMISYSVNFTIYCSMSKKFRETFRDLFCCKLARRKRDKRMMYQSQAQHSMYEPCTQVHQFTAPASSALINVTHNNSNNKSINNINNNNNKNNNNHPTHRGSAIVANTAVNNLLQGGNSCAPSSNGKSAHDGYKPRLSCEIVATRQPNCEV